MNTVKPLKGLSLQHSPKKPYRLLIKRMVPTILFAVLIGTYLDLLFVAKQLYSFPNRPFQAIFPVNLFYLLAGLPISTIFFLLLMNIWNPLVVLLGFSLLNQIMEQAAELIGFFRHGRIWSHTNTFLGSLFFYAAVYSFHKWIND